MPKTVAATDDTLQVFTDRKLDSNVLARIAKGEEVELGETYVFEGREWIRVTIRDGTSGWVLAPSARSHTTLAAESRSFAELAAMATTSDSGSKGPTPLVFRPTGGVQWPKYCVKCFSQSPTRVVTLSVKGASTTAQKVGYTAAGVIIGGGIAGGLGGFLASFTGGVHHYSVPICASCKRLLPRFVVRDLERPTEGAATSFLSWGIEKGCVVLTFENTAYDAAFRTLNRGSVFDSVDDCLGTRKSSGKSDIGTAASAARAEEVKSEPCMGCGQMIPKGEMVCPFCGHTRWGMMLFFLLAGAAFIGVGYEFCEPGIWRWLWWILGGFLALISLVGVIKRISYYTRKR